MFFANKEHRNNYEELMIRYRLTPGQDIQYESSIYVAAFPEIFEAIDKNRLNSHSPLFALTEWSEEEERHVFVAPELTGSTRRMCELALSLYNGYQIGLDEVFGSVVNPTMLQVLFQSMKIRARI